LIKPRGRLGRKEKIKRTRKNPENKKGLATSMTMFDLG